MLTQWLQWFHTTFTLNRLEAWLRTHVPFKEIGWEEIGEKFTRWMLVKFKRLPSIYVHKLDAPIRHPQCHDHPWHFWAFVVNGGYFEEMNGNTVWRAPGSLLYRPARSLHNTITKEGRPSWSIIIVSPVVRKWGFRHCDTGEIVIREVSRDHSPGNYEGA